MFEKELVKLQREIGELKLDLMGNGGSARLGDEEGYQLATKIDLTVSRVLRIIDYKCETAP